MVTGLEVGVLVLVLLAVAAVYLLLKVVKPLVVNTVVGLVVLFGAGLFGFGVQLTPAVVLIVAFGGVPAALLVILLAQLGIVFTPALVMAGLPAVPF